MDVWELIWKLSIAIVSRAPVFEDADNAVTRNQTLCWFDIAVRAWLVNVRGVVPQIPGSDQVAIVVNAVGAVPRPYWSDQVTERGWTLSIIRSIEPAVSVRPVESKLKLNAAPGSPKLPDVRRPIARFVEAFCDSLEAVPVRPVAEAVLMKPLVLTPHVCLTTLAVVVPSEVPVAAVRTSQPAGSVAAPVPVPRESNDWT